MARTAAALGSRPPRSHLAHLECMACRGKTSPDALVGASPCCDAPLAARYDLDAAREHVDGRELAGLFAGTGVWRYAPLLPDPGPMGPVTLAEGGTPILDTPRLAAKHGLKRLLLKDESRNPTGTFKARGMSLAVTMARRQGARVLAVPTAGNAGGALAAYAACAGLEAIVAMPHDAPAANKAEVRAAGARLIEVDGLLPACAERLASDPAARAAFHVTTFREPYRLEGKKTIGFELFESLGGRFPDVVLIPTGGGIGILALLKAHEELAAIGVADPVPPRLFAVQAEGCAPFVAAHQAGADHVTPVAGAQTVAGGIRVPAPRADRAVLAALRATGGTAVAVPEHAIGAAMRELAASTGLLVGPESGAAYAGIAELVRAGGLDGAEEIAVLLTGTGLKHLELF